MKNVKRFKRIFKFLIILYLIYLYVFGLIIFKVYHRDSPPFSYDVDEFTEVSKEETFAYLVEDRQFALDARIALISVAQSTIDISYYTIHEGLASEVLFGALIDAANRGVKVRVIVDGLSNIINLSQDDFLALRANKNVIVKGYEALNIIKPYAINNTLHDKLLIIDEKYGLIGGRNIEDRMFIEDHNPVKETYDRDVLIFGNKDKHQTVSSMKNYYEELFNHKYSKTLTYKESNKTKQVANDLINIYKKFLLNNDINSVLNTLHQDAIRVQNATFIRSPLTRLNKYPVVFNTLIELSQKYDELFIQSPYLIINNEMKKYLNDLENKDITILTNNLDYNPNYFATSGYIRYRKKIAQNTKLYEFQSQSSIHAKTIVMGDEISIIGSFNIDPRSTFLSTESVVVIYSQEFTAHLNNTLSQYLNQSLEVDDDGNYISKINVEAVNKRNRKRKIIRLLSFFTYFHDELL